MNRIFLNIMLLVFCCSFMIMSCSSDSLDDQIVGKDDDKDSTETEVLTHSEKAKEVYDLIQERYRAGDLYKENFPAQGGENQYSYLWPYVGMLTAANVLYELGYDESILKKEFEGLEAYYDNRESLPAYQAYPVAEQSTGPLL